MLLPSLEEIQSALHDMPDWKAPGPDSIQAGLIKAGG